MWAARTLVGKPAGGMHPAVGPCVSCSLPRWHIHVQPAAPEPPEPSKPPAALLPGGEAPRSDALLAWQGGIFHVSSNSASWWLLQTFRAVGAPGFSGGGSDFNFIAFEPNSSMPYVAFTGLISKTFDYGGGNLQTRMADGNITVMRWNGASWDLVGPANFSTTDPKYVRLVFEGTSSVPYVAYDPNDSSGLVVMRLDDNDWVRVGGDALNFDQHDYIPNGLKYYGQGPTQPYLAFQPNSSIRESPPPAHMWLVTRQTGERTGGCKSDQVDMSPPRWIAACSIPCVHRVRTEGVRGNV